MRSVLVLLALTVCCSSAFAQSLDSRDRHYLGRFDQTFAKAKQARQDPKSVGEDAARKHLRRLKMYLGQISYPGKKTTDYATREKQLAGFRAKVDQVFGSAKPIKPKPIKPKPVVQWPAPNRAGKPYPVPAPRAAADDQPVSPEAKPHLGRFWTYLKEHRAALKQLEGPELELRHHIHVLKRILSGFSHQGAKDACLAIRRASWEIARFRHALDQAYGSLPRVPWGSRERDRLSSISSKLSRRGRNKSGLWYQDPKHVAEKRKELAGYRSELDAMKSLKKVARSRDWVDTEFDYREAVARLEAEIERSRALKEGAGDLGKRLREIQATFPRPGFDPSYRGPRRAKEVRQWAKTLRNWRDGLPRIEAFFKRAVASSVEARTKEFYGYRVWFGRNVGSRIGKAVRTAERWADIRHATFARATHLTADSTDKQVRRVLGKIDEAAERGAMGAAFQEGFHGKVAANLERDLAEVLAIQRRLHREGSRVNKDRRLPPVGHMDPALLAQAKRVIEGRFGASEVRGLRLTGKPTQYAHSSVGTGGWVTKTWWRKVWLAAAVRKQGRWYIASFSMERRTYNTGKAYGEWTVSGEPSYAREIPEENIDK